MPWLCHTLHHRRGCSAALCAWLRVTHHLHTPHNLGDMLLKAWVKRQCDIAYVNIMLNLVTNKTYQGAASECQLDALPLCQVPITVHSPDRRRQYGQHKQSRQDGIAGPACNVVVGGGDHQEEAQAAGGAGVHQVPLLRLTCRWVHGLGSWVRSW